MKTLIIPADGSEVRWEDPETITLPYLQDKVGGDIQAIGVGNEITMYLNEDGKAKRLPTNRMATRLAKKYAGISLTDYIVGDVVLVGAADDEGWDTGLTSRAKAWLEMQVRDLG